MTDYATAYEAMSLNPYADLRSTGLLALNKLQVRLQMADEIIKQVAGATVTRDKRRAEIGGGTFEAAVAYLKEYND